MRADELSGLGLARLHDADNDAISLESRFDPGYGATHALSLAALRHHGFRASNRYIVFQVLPHTLGLGPEVWRVLDKCHKLRSQTEYEGILDVDERPVTDPIGGCRDIEEDEHTAVVPEPATLQMGQEALTHGGVFRRAFPEPDGRPSGKTGWP